MLKILMLSLLFTLALELPVALLWGFRGRDLLLCALVNLLTNPAVVLLHTLFPHPAVTVLLELGAVAVEGRYYRCYAAHTERPWLLALTANSCSFFLGPVLYAIL